MLLKACCILSKEVIILKYNNNNVPEGVTNDRVVSSPLQGFGDSSGVDIIVLYLQGVVRRGMWFMWYNT